MQTMYDRLGDLLNETLDAGEVRFVKVPVGGSAAAGSDRGFSPEGDSSLDTENLEPAGAKNMGTESEPVTDGDSIAGSRFGTFREGFSDRYRPPEQEAFVYKAGDPGVRVEKPKLKSFVYRKITPELEWAYRLLSVETSATPEQIKKAYKEKLKYYHPDRHAGNQVLEKVANEKTTQVLKAFELIRQFLDF